MSNDPYGTPQGYSAPANQPVYQPSAPQPPQPQGYPQQFGYPQPMMGQPGPYAPMPKPGFDFAAALKDKSKLMAFVTACSALFIFIGSLGTWIKLSGPLSSIDSLDDIPTRGTEGDGIFTLLIALALIGVAVSYLLLKNERRKLVALPIVATVLSALSALVPLIAFGQVSTFNDEYGKYLKVAAGWGLIFVLIFSLACLGTSIAWIILAVKKQHPIYPGMSAPMGYPGQPMMGAPMGQPSMPPAQPWGQPAPAPQQWGQPQDNSQPSMGPQGY